MTDNTEYIRGRLKSIRANLRTSAEYFRYIKTDTPEKKVLIALHMAVDGLYDIVNQLVPKEEE